MASEPRPTPVVFDDDCGLCRATARILGRLDRRGRLELVPFSEARRRGLAKDLKDEEFEAAFHAIVGDRTVSGSEAIPVLLERLPLGSLPARAIRTSRPLRAVVRSGYEWVARNRHRLGRVCRCEGPSPDPGKEARPPKDSSRS